MRSGLVRSIDRHPTSLEPGPGRWRRRPVLLTVPLVVILVLVTWLLAFGLTRDPTVYRNPLVGHRAPDFALRSLDGNGTLRLSGFRGQVVVVNFWASWCAPCRQEHADLQAAWDRYRDQGAVVVGIVYQDAASSARAFDRELGGDWPSAIDPGSRTALAYGVRGAPETFFIARDGTVAAQHNGPVSYELLTGEISRLLRRGAA